MLTLIGLILLFGRLFLDFENPDPWWVIAAFFVPDTILAGIFDSICWRERRERQG